MIVVWPMVTVFFETIRIVKGKEVLSRAHWDRLKRGCDRLLIKLDLSQLQAYFNQVLSAREGLSGVIKVIVTRGSGARGYNPAGLNWRSVISWNRLPCYPEEYKRKGVSLYPCKTVLGHQPQLAGLKHLNRLEQVLARGEWGDAKYADGVVCDMYGNIIECTMSNLFMVRNGVLVTPELSRCGVAGTLRQWLIGQWLIDNAADPVSCENIQFSDLNAMEEVFVCNSIFGIWPVVSYAGMQWPVGSVTRYLQGKIEKLFS